MNRFFVYCALLFLLFAPVSGCVKKQIVVNRLEGSWSHIKTLYKDGSYEYFSNRTLTFKGGKADGKNYLEMTYSDDGVETTGKYSTDKHGQMLYIMPDCNIPQTIDTLTIEDMDKNSLVARSLSGIRFYDKN